ncbi:MAG: hypothetical protein ACI4LK_02250 [Lentihominibacter sp.]
MKRTFRKVMVWSLTVIMALTMFTIPVAATDSAPDSGSGSAAVEKDIDESGAAADELAAEESQPAEEDVASGEDETAPASAMEVFPMATAGATVTGTFDKVSGKDIATIRYYVDAEKKAYSFADFSYNSSTQKYTYTFKAPYDGFTATNGTSKDDAKATVIAEYYSTTKWDGAVDVSWYSEGKDTYSIGDPAQLAGLAAIVNGSINNSTPIYRVKGERSDLTKQFDYDTPQTTKKQDINEGLPDVIENEYDSNASLVAGITDEAYMGLAKNDFSDKTVKITEDLDMGGVDGSQIDHSKNFSGSTTDSSGKNSYDYPNWTPIGGEYLMDPSDGSTMIVASFNGTIDGCGHDITNVYCFRWSYRTVGDTAYGYAQGTGLVGMMGSLYDGEDNPKNPPSLRNMSLSGYFFGRRMVGGFVGCMGGGSNAASGSSVEGGIKLENLANHAYAYCTDSKGLGGIVACSMVDKGTIVNCYNDGYLETVYANPTGGIVGANEGMSIYCCYNTGKLNTNGNKRGRGIGCDSSGSNYTVDDCYYLEGCGDDDKYPGYYSYNLAKSVSVNTVSMTEKEMTDGTLLEKLNVNGKAYVEGSDGYPVLYWEKNSGTGTLTLSQPSAGGKLIASATGSIANGTVVYLSSETEKGWKCRYYTLNGSKLSGNYVTVNGASTVSAKFEEAAPEVLRIKDNDVCDIEITKNGIIKNGDNTEEVEDYPVKSGDPVYEGDFLVITAKVKDGKTPEDENLTYKYTAKLSNPFTYEYSYVNEDDEIIGETTSTEVPTFKVGSDITADGAALTLDVKPLTCKKMWDYVADKSWYDSSKSDFTLTTAEELAGLSVLVDEGNTFAGKTVKLGNNISLKNNDGTSGKRYWDGIGNDDSAPFAGTFDGCGHEITDYEGSANGLFEYVAGTSATDRAEVRNLTIRGSSEGQNACAFAAKAKNADISKCISYCTVKSTNGNGHAASIVGYATDKCTISDCRNYAVVEGIGYVGGIAGELKGTCEITDCVNRGNVYSLNTGGNYVGGVVGSLSGKLTASANYGNVEAYGRNIGGVAGYAGASTVLVDRCYNAGTVTYDQGTNTYDCIGGIIGFGSKYVIKKSFNCGTIEKLEGSMPASNVGAVVGREGKNSSSSTENVYYLNTTCDYAQGGMKQNELDTTASYSKGIKQATAAEFADKTKVLEAVNENSVFNLKEAGYPELASASGEHIHNGGTATCADLAVCEDCGLSYGLYSREHGETKLVGDAAAVWTNDGYTGDTVCKECGKVLKKGSVIAADLDATAIEVKVMKGSKEVSAKSYTVKQFDSMKKTSPAIAYTYGGENPQIEAVTQYVTLEDVFKDQGLTCEDVDSIKVVCAANTDTISMEKLNTWNKYYEKGKEYDAPAAFAIARNTGVGDLATIARESEVRGSLRFGYGVSPEMANESVGGKRLVSPVNSLEIYLAQPKVNYQTNEDSEAEICYLSDAISKINENGGIITFTEDVYTEDEGLVIDAGSNTAVIDLGSNGYELSGDVTVKSGTLNIQGTGKIDGKLSASKAGTISAAGGAYTYEIEKDYCASGYVPVYDKETELYTITEKTAYQAQLAANALRHELDGIVAEISSMAALINELNATIEVNDTTVTAKAAAANYKTVTLTWSANRTVACFKVEKKINGSWTELNPTTTGKYTDSGEPGITNEYRVAAGVEYEGLEGEKLVKYGKYVTASAKPGIGKATAPKVTSKSKKLTVKWTSVAGADSYDVWVGTNSSVTKGLVKYNNVKSRSKVTKKLKKGKTYYVKVRAHVKNSRGTVVYGAWSTAKKIKCK